MSQKSLQKWHIENQRITKKVQKKVCNIWSVRKKAVILHPLSKKREVLLRQANVL